MCTSICLGADICPLPLFVWFFSQQQVSVCFVLSCEVRNNVGQGRRLKQIDNSEAKRFRIEFANEGPTFNA